MLKEAWTIAIETLSWIELRGLSEHIAFEKTVKQLGINDPNAARLANMLAIETVRRQNFIDAFINNALKPKSLDEFDLGVQSFLRLYVYQTRMAKNWNRIDVKEAENIASLGRSILGWRAIQPVERVLGLLLTQKPVSIFQNTSDEEKIGLSTFHPTWFVKYCIKTFGRQETLALLEANTEMPSTYIRFNTLRATGKEILKRLVEDGVQAERVEGLQHTLLLKNAKRVLTMTSSYHEGLFYIQNKASCFAAEAARPKPGMTVLDICAAPGAKTTYLAQLMRNRGSVYSVDYSKRRMAAWKKETARMGVRIATPLIAHACNSMPLAIRADVVVLDPPCTSTGVFGKMPSAKWRLTSRSIGRMADIQWQMINNWSENVKPKGALVYSTCSITVEENEMLIERFLKWHSEFSLTEITPKIGLPGLRGLEKCQRLYPHIHKCNGFFIAKLLKD